MKRQVFLPIVHENPYFSFPEAVGYYKYKPQHYAIREKNEKEENLVPKNMVLFI